MKLKISAICVAISLHARYRASSHLAQIDARRSKSAQIYKKDKNEAQDIRNLYGDDSTD